MGFEWAEMERQPCPAGKPAEVAPNSAWGVGDYRPFVSSPKPGPYCVQIWEMHGLLLGIPNKKAPGPGCPQEALAMATGQCRQEAPPLSRLAWPKALKLLALRQYPSTAWQAASPAAQSRNTVRVPAASGVAALSAGAGG